MKKKLYKRLLSFILCAAMLAGMLPLSALPAGATAESSCLNILNRPGASILMEHEFTSDTYDLWNEMEAEGPGELAFNQSFSVHISDAIDTYNNYLDTNYPDGSRDHFKASEDINNNATFYVEATVWINNTSFSSSALYQLHPYDLRPYENFSYGKWSPYTNELSEDFFSMTVDGYVLNFAIDGTVKEIYESLKAQDASLGETTVDSMSFEVRVSCEVEYVDWYIKSTEYHFEASSHSMYDKHIYEPDLDEVPPSAISTVAPLTAKVFPAYEGCYEPVKTEYSWYYEFIKEGEDEVDGQWYGYFEKDETKESDVLTEVGPSGTVFGVAYGIVDSGDKNYITLSDILNEDNKAFINSFIGAKPRELGGIGQMFIGCTVTLTFADGKQRHVNITKADYMSTLVAPCMHACTVCGYCTVTDLPLPCNFDRMYYEIRNICICDEPSVPDFEVTVESETQMTIESTERTVKVVVEKIEVEEAPTHAFIINTTNAVGADNVLALYNINVFDEEGFPYTLNQWYDEGEELTVSVSVSVEYALALQSGEAVLYHILADGTAEAVEDVTVVIDGDSATMTFTSNSFSPFVLAYENTAPCTHTSMIPLSGKEPTCTEYGHKGYYKCSCGLYFEDASASAQITDVDAWKADAGKLAAKGHTYTEQLQDADHLKDEGTCSAYKTYWYDCADCDASAKDDTEAADKFYTGTEKGEHSWGSLNYGYPATFVEAGCIDHYQCGACGKYFDAKKQEVDSIVIPKLSTDLSICVNGTPVALALTEQTESSLSWTLEGLSVTQGDVITICQTDNPGITHSYFAGGDNNNVDTEGKIRNTAASADVALAWTPNGFQLTVGGYEYLGIVIEINGVQYPMHFVTYPDGETTSYIYGYVAFAAGDQFVIVDNVNKITYNYDDLAASSSWNTWDFHRGENGQIVMDFATRYGIEFDWMGSKEIDLTKVFAPFDGNSYEVVFGNQDLNITMDEEYYAAGSATYEEALWYVLHEKVMNKADIVSYAEEKGLYFYSAAVELSAGDTFYIKNLTADAIITADHLAELYADGAVVEKEGDHVKAPVAGTYYITYIPALDTFAIDVVPAAPEKADVYMYLDGNFIPMTTDSNGCAVYENLKATTSTNIMFTDSTYAKYLPITLSSDTNSSYAYVYQYGSMSMLFFSKAGTYNLSYNMQTGELTITSAVAEPENPVVNYTYYLTAVDSVNGNTSSVMSLSSENAKEYCKKNFAISASSYIRVTAYGDDGSSVYHYTLSDTPSSVASPYSSLIKVNLTASFDIYFNTETQTVRIVPLTAHAHVWSDWTPDGDENHKRTCSAEGCPLVTETAPHSFDNGVVTESGATLYTCTVCGGTKTVEPETLVLTEDTQVKLELTADLYVDLSGFDLGGTIVTNGKKLYLTDSSTDGYTCENIGYFNCVDGNGEPIVPERICTVGEKQYLTIHTDAGYSFHRFFVGVTHMSLNAEAIGVGYKSAVCGDEMVFGELAAANAFTFRLQLEGYNPVYRYFDRDELTDREPITLRVCNYDVDGYSETPLSAQVSITLADGTVIEAEEVSFTFRWLAEEVDANYTDYTPEQLAAFKAMLEKFAIVKTWKIPNLI